MSQTVEKCSISQC